MKEFAFLPCAVVARMWAFHNVFSAFKTGVVQTPRVYSSKL